MKKRGVVLLGALLCVLASAGMAIAQEQTGSIQGTIKDATGAVLPGATVEARSPSAVGVSSTVTDVFGVYRFPALPPGRYEVSATLQGFKPAKQENVYVTLGKMLTIDLALAIGSVSETVQVSGESPLIDVKQNAAFATIQADAINRMPKGRDFQTILALAPGAQSETRNGGIQVDGASGTENRFIIDGMDTTSISDGSSGKTLLLDFIQEVQVKSSGYNAEYGGTTGGVVSAITKSGSNSLHGQLGTYYQSNANSFWIGDRRAFNRYDPYNSNKTNLNYKTPDIPYTYWSPLADVGGPIFKDKLWFYGGAGYTKNSYNEDVTFYSDPNRVKRHFDWWSTTKYFNYNLTTQVTNNLRIKLAGQNQRDANRKTNPTLQPEGYVFPDGTVATTPFSTSTFDKNPDGSVNQAAFDSRWIKQGGNSTSDIFSGNVDWVVTNTFFVNVSGGYYSANNTTPPEFTGNQLRHTFGASNSDAVMIAAGFPTVPAQYQQVNGYTDNISSSRTAKNQWVRIFANANLTWFKNWKGQHTFKVGGRFERIGNDALNGATKPTVTLRWAETATTTAGQSKSGVYGVYAITRAYTGGNVHSNNLGFWIQDGWAINSRLTINAGVRTENENLPAYNADLYPNAQSIKYGFKEKIAPRAGFAYDVKGDGKWKAYGSFGFYYTITPLLLARGSMGGDHWIDYVYTLDTPDWASISCEPGPSGCPGTFIVSSDLRKATNLPDPAYSAYFGIPDMTGIDKNIKPVKTGEFTAGLDHELTQLMALRFRYVHKWAIRAQDDMGVLVPSGDEYYVLTNPGIGFGKFIEPSTPDVPSSKPKRNYDAVEVNLHRRLSNRWSADVSYVWSRLFGNWSGLTSSDEPSSSNAGRSSSPDATRYWDNLIMSYDSKGHQVYGLLSTDRPHTVKLSGSYELPTGTSIGAYYIIESGTPQTTVMKFGQFLSAYSYPVYINGRGDLGRSPRFSQLDMVLQQDVRLGKKMRLSAQLNVDNVFDQKTWTALYNMGGYGPDPYRDGILMSLPNAQLPLLTGYDPAALSAAYTGTHRVNQLYKTPNTFQGRRQARVSVKFTF